MVKKKFVQGSRRNQDGFQILTNNPTPFQQEPQVLSALMEVTTPHSQVTYKALTHCGQLPTLKTSSLTQLDLYDNQEVREKHEEIVQPEVPQKGRDGG